jgi:hypothetical protein
MSGRFAWARWGRWFGLSDTAERKMPEHIVDKPDKVENALSKKTTFGRATILLEPEKSSL